MKYQSLTPRAWAAVVVAGGALCALPFLQRSGNDSIPEPGDDRGLSLPHATSAAGTQRPTLIGETRGDAVSSIEAVSQIPDWVAQSRSPFDELMAGKQPTPIDNPPSIAKPELPPLEPWIMIPGESSTEPAPSVKTSNISLPNGTGSQKLTGYEQHASDLSKISDRNASIGSDVRNYSPWENTPAINTTSSGRDSSWTVAKPNNASVVWPDERGAVEGLRQFVIAKPLQSAIVAETSLTPPGPALRTPVQNGFPEPSALPVATQIYPSTMLNTSGQVVPDSAVTGKAGLGSSVGIGLSPGLPDNRATAIIQTPGQGSTSIRFGAMDSGNTRDVSSKYEVSGPAPSLPSSKFGAVTSEKPATATLRKHAIFQPGYRP